MGLISSYFCVRKCSQFSDHKICPHMFQLSWDLALLVAGWQRVDLEAPDSDEDINGEENE